MTRDVRELDSVNESCSCLRAVSSLRIFAYPIKVPHWSQIAFRFTYFNSLFGGGEDFTGVGANPLFFRVAEELFDACISRSNDALWIQHEHRIIPKFPYLHSVQVSGFECAQRYGSLWNVCLH